MDVYWFEVDSIMGFSVAICFTRREDSVNLVHLAKDLWGLLVDVNIGIIFRVGCGCWVVDFNLRDRQGSTFLVTFLRLVVGERVVLSASTSWLSQLWHFWIKKMSKILLYSLGKKWKIVLNLNQVNVRLINRLFLTFIVFAVWGFLEDWLLVVKNISNLTYLPINYLFSIPQNFIF
jgi:hypothetical protein